jgi:hypothetical protein
MNADGVRKQLLSTAVEKNLNIISLQSGSRKLEDIFKSLTQSSASVSA